MTTHEHSEPVAWGMQNDDGRIYDCITPEEHDRHEGEYTVPLYAAPPAQQAQRCTPNCEAILADLLKAQRAPNIAVTWDLAKTRILAVSLQDDEGRILQVIDEAPAQQAQPNEWYEALEFAARHLSSDWPEECQQIVRKARKALREQPAPQEQGK